MTLEEVAEAISAMGGAAQTAEVYALDELLVLPTAGGDSKRGMKRAALGGRWPGSMRWVVRSLARSGALLEYSWMVAVSVELLPDSPATEVVTAIEVADVIGLDTAFLVDEVYHRDAWLLLAIAAARTRRIRLAAGVAHVTLRDPLLMAQMLATLDEVSGGRAAAAFSVGNLAMLEQFGRDPGELHVAPRLREAHDAMRAFLDAGRVDFEGRFFSYRGVFSTARPVGPRVPLLIGAMGGPLTFRLAGELADGVYAACSFTPEALRYVVDNVRHGAEKASRDWRSLELCASLTSAISEDGESARIAARIKAAFYLPSMPRALIERHGVPFTEVEPINEAFARGDVATALRRTPPELADRFCIAGTPEEVAAKIKADVLPSGINHVALALTDRSQPLDWAGIELPDLPDLADQIRLIGERVLPAL